MRDNWTKTAQYLIKYKQKWERAVKKSDGRDEEKESDEEIKMQWKTVVCRFRYRIIRNRKCNIR
jgi:hypothetical protein